MKKSIEQMKLDVSNANNDIDLAEVAPYQFLLCRLKVIFDILCKKYGWDSETINDYYPPETIRNAIAQGWREVMK